MIHSVCNTVDLTNAFCVSHVSVAVRSPAEETFFVEEATLDTLSVLGGGHSAADVASESCFPNLPFFHDGRTGSTMVGRVSKAWIRFDSMTTDPYCRRAMEGGNLTASSSTQDICRGLGYNKGGAYDGCILGLWSDTVS